MKRRGMAAGRAIVGPKNQHGDNRMGIEDGGDGGRKDGRLR